MNRILPFLICLTASLYFFYITVMMSIFNIVNPIISKDFALTASQMGLLSSSFLFANAVFVLPAGFLFDKCSSRKLMLSTFLLAIGATFLFSQTHSFSIALLCCFCLGIASGFVFLGNIKCASEWFKNKRMDIAVGLMVAIGMSGGIFSNAILANVFTPDHWRIMFVDISVAGFILWIIMLFSFKENRPFSASIETNIYSLQALKDHLSIVLKNSQNWLNALFVSFINLPLFILGSLWGVSYLSIHHHLPHQLAATITGCLFIGITIGCPFIGILSNRSESRRGLMLVCSGFAFLTYLVFMYFIGKSSLPYNLLTFFIGVFMSVQILSYTLLATNNAMEVSSTAQGFASTLSHLIGALCQTLFGVMIDSITPSFGISNAYQFTMWMIPLAFIAAFFLVFFIKEKVSSL